MHAKFRTIKMHYYSQESKNVLGFHYLVKAAASGFLQTHKMTRNWEWGRKACSTITARKLCMLRQWMRSWPLGLAEPEVKLKQSRTAPERRGEQKHHRATPAGQLHLRPLQPETSAICHREAPQSRRKVSGKPSGKDWKGIIHSKPYALSTQRPSIPSYISH